MTIEYGILLFILGIMVTVGFFGILFWAMDDRPKPKTALDEDNYDWRNFNHIIDNQNMTVYEQCLDIQNWISTLNI